ncbi:hypothetical protein [Microbacterium sp.]|uniref:hypothetical protein n=1 Tax=Microbacterium sp. TaxID=51671 RepID=UPI0025E45A0D|nr:hypothetical protein [Microbacterium sp.]MBT9605282.1 hypothetical protein [Microbacterium sp.]
MSTTTLAASTEESGEPEARPSARTLPRRDATPRIRLVHVDGREPEDFPPLPSGLRVKSLHATSGGPADLRVRVLTTNGLLWQLRAGGNRWEEEAYGIERVHVDRFGTDTVLLRADGVFEVTHKGTAARWEQPTRWARAPRRSVLISADPWGPGIYALSAEGDLSVIRGTGSSLIDRRVTAISAHADEHGSLVYARPREFRLARPDGSSSRLGPRFRESKPWSPMVLTSVTATTGAGGARAIFAHDIDQNLHVWSSTCTSTLFAALGEVMAFPEHLGDHRGVVSTRHGSVRWVYANGQTLPVDAGPLPGRVRAMELRTEVTPDGNRTVYARGTDARLYAFSSSSPRWRALGDDIDAFEIVPGSMSAVIASLS